MSIYNTSSTYGLVAKLFHWVIFLLVLIMVSGGFFLGDLPKDIQPLAYTTHKLTGLFILILMVLRLCWALMNIKPALPAMTAAWEKMAERLVHGLLYASLIAMPLFGWVGSTAAGRPPKLGDWVFALPIAPNDALKEWAFEWHERIAFIIIALVAVHAAAALYHHVIKRDDVLRRMLPKGWL